jgi:arylsulfatase A-like enzyme
MRWPQRIRPGTSTEALCSNADIAPTLIELAGGKPPEDMRKDGDDLRPLLAGEATAHHEFIYLEMHNSRAVVTDRWKLLLNRPPQSIRDRMDADAKESAETGVPRRLGWDGIQSDPIWGGIWFYTDRIFPHYFDNEQLYDLIEDPFEQNNLIADPRLQQEVGKLQQLLRNKLGSLPHTYDVSNAGSAVLEK